MTSRFSQPIICPLLIGREAAMDALQRLAVEAGAGGRVALISGEAGIGKSRLLTQFLEENRGSDLAAWQSRFFEKDSESPYSGISRLITGLAERHANAGTLLTPVASELCMIAPHAVSNVVGPSASAVTENPVPETEERRIIDALRRLARSLCSAGPAILAFDDVHWADRTSLAAILDIARDATPGCLIVLTYRTDERSPALDSILAELDRERLSAEIHLARLSLADVDRMLAAILNSNTGTRADILHLVARLSGGNPFLVEEVTRSVLDRAGGIEALGSRRITEIEVPRSVNDAVRRRTEELSQGASAVLSIAAVAGVRFDFPLLSELSGTSEEQLLAILKELISAQLVVEEAEDTFAFRHALTREAIRSQLLLRERRSLSRRIALALESRYAAASAMPVEDLAWHFFEAGEWAPAFRYSREAGERALSLYAPAEALSHLTRAIEAGERVADAPLAETHRLRGSANEAIGNFEAARTDYERAASLAISPPEARTQWQALIDLGLLWASRDYTRSEPYYRSALELARQMNDPLAMGHSLNRLGNLYSNRGDFDNARQLSEEALSTFRQAGDQLGVAQTLDLLGMTCLQGMQFERSVTYYREAIELLDHLGERRTLASALSSIQVCASTYQTSMLPPALPLAEAAALGERGLAIARKLGWRSAEAYALWQLAFCLGPQGDYDNALAYGQDSLRIAREIGHTQWEVGALCALAAVYIDLLAPEQAQEYLARADGLCREMGSNAWAGQVGALKIEALLSTLLERLTARLHDPSSDVEPGGFGIRVLLAARGELAVANGDTALATSILGQLMDGLPPASPKSMALRLERLAGLLLASSGDLTGGVETLRRAEEGARFQGNVGYQWRLNADLARLLLDMGDRDAARAAARQATEVATKIANRLPDRSLADAFLSRALTHLPAVLRGRTRGARDGLLTARETETALLIAAGLTNREIAEKLILSVRTVESHVANAMAKLGFTTRSQLAAWAAEHGRTGSNLPRA
jgi:DNA-binding CsgD family transcriptional regulator